MGWDASRLMLMVLRDLCYRSAGAEGEGGATEEHVRVSEELVAEDDIRRRMLKQDNSNVQRHFI